ncbi:MAG: phosphoenolpyruvate carboxylase, partial [Pedobacter sp.]
FIISNCQQASDILQLIELFLWNGWSKDALTIDFVPLFETVNDLKGAADIMDTLYSNPFYKTHLASRGNKQDIMLGYSDSTKDGGYLMANWSIFNGKTSLSAIAKKHNIQLAFFDGRGGPPARGGGKTHRFYASMGKEIANKNMQLTVQGQTISSQYGSVESAEFNIEQLINAGISSGLKEKHNVLLDPENKSLLDEMAEDAYKAFVDLREHPLFVSYLEKLSPLKLLSQANISSRPVKRNGGGEMKLEDLRAISFVTAWSMLKQNVPGFEEPSFVHTHESGEQVVSIRTNPAKFNIASSHFDVEEKVQWSSCGYYLKQRPSFTTDPLFHAGCYYVQEASSMFLEQALKQSVDLTTPIKVLDLCAAPGGKSTHIQSLISADSLLVSNEVIKARAGILKQNIVKWGGSNVIVTNNDPQHFSRLEGFFDVIVVDAPCSGSGLFRRDDA